MGWAEMVLGIVFIGCVTGLVKDVLRRRSEGSAAGGEELDAQAARLEELEERVRVLEAVVTDERVQLRREIDRL